MRVVMLGTGTDVGKTYVTSRLAEGLRHRTRVLALKPIESGVVAGAATDAARIASAAGHAEACSPWRFARPVSPHLAARDEQQSIDVAAVVDWVATQERGQAPTSITLIETAGGAFSPLALHASNVQLAQALEPAVWILVAPDSLGVLHDLSVTLRALPRRPDAVVLSAARTPDASSGTNATELESLQITPVLAVVAAGDAALPVVEWLLARST